MMVDDVVAGLYAGTTAPAYPARMDILFKAMPQNCQYGQHFLLRAVSR